MYSTAVEDGVVDSNPIRGVRLPTSDTDEDEQKHAKALSREELRVFFAALPEDGYWRLFFEFLAVTGLRIGEAVHQPEGPGLLDHHGIRVGSSQCPSHRPAPGSHQSRLLRTGRREGRQAARADHDRVSRFPAHLRIDALR